ncbi:hypothetical protein DL93DRAFT_2084811 [Clavulina sp. PMI_390]|nr:hypothetical protein DL93DRAFT_2084811 [Clavulina sp. PMI_390]
MNHEEREVDIADQVPSLASGTSESPHPAEVTSLPGTDSLQPFCLTPFKLLSLLVPLTFGISKTALVIGGLSLVPNALDIALSLLAASLCFISWFENTTNSSFIRWLFKYDVWALIKRGSVIFDFPAPWDSYTKLFVAMICFAFSWGFILGDIQNERKSDDYQTPFGRVVQGRFREELSRWEICCFFTGCIISMVILLVYDEYPTRAGKLLNVTAQLVVTISAASWAYVNPLTTSTISILSLIVIYITCSIMYHVVQSRPTIVDVSI